MALKPFKLIFAAAIFLHLLCASLLACSYADGSLPSTEYDLIKKADAILLAQPRSKNGYSVDFNVIEVLKGDFHGTEFQGSELHTSCEDRSYSVELERYLPPLLAQKVPKVYPKYVLFLERTRNGGQLWSHAANSINEMILNQDTSPFLKTVRHFIRISSANNYEIEKRELRKLRQLAQTSQDPKEYPKELIGLIDRHLTSPTPSKSYKDLVSLYTRSSKERSDKSYGPLPGASTPRLQSLLRPYSNRRYH